MPGLPELGCKPPSPSPTGCSVTAASEHVDEASKLMATTRSITSMDSSSIMSDEHETSRAFDPLMPQQSTKSDSPPRSTSPEATPSSSSHYNSLDSTSIHSQQSTHQQTAPGSRVPHRETSQYTRDEPILTASTDASADADSRSSDLSGSFADSCLKGKGAEMSRKPRASHFLSSIRRLGRLVPVEGSIGSYHEYVRPNAETSFLFSFTPMTGTGHHHEQSCGNTLIGCLENIRADNGPAAAGQKSIKLRRRRCVDVRSLTFDDWRPGTDSQKRRDEPSQATRRKSVSDPTQLATELDPDTKTTADRQRFDFLVSRLQQKLSERSQDRSSGSTNAPSISEVSRQSSQAGSAHSNKPAPQNTTESSQRSVCVDNNGLSSDHMLSTEDKAYANNENQGQPKLEAPLHTQQSAPGLHQPFPAQFQGNTVQSVDYLPQLFPSLMQQLPQYPGLWNGHSNQASGLGHPTHPTMAFHQAYPSPSLQPQMVAWPPAPGVHPHFGTYPYVEHPQGSAPLPTPLPHQKPPTSPKKSKSKSRGHIPFVQLNAAEQQKIEEHIEFLKATVPSFAMVSKRRQRQRWLKETSNRESQQRQQEELMKKSMQSYQPVPLQPEYRWDPQAYQQLQQYYHHGYIPATATSQALMHGPPPLYNPIPYTNIPWSSL